MKKRSSISARYLILFGFVLWGELPLCRAQNGPRLALVSLYDRPALSLTGEAGAINSIQMTTGFSTANRWNELTLVQLGGLGIVWMDPSPFTASERFYRAVSLPRPADPNLLFIQPGAFTMGSPTDEALRFPDEVQHLVTISRGFWMGKFLVTQKEYLAILGKNPSYFTAANGFAEDLTRPVEQVSWSDATNYCARLTARELAADRIPTNCVFRLPTESEWEYACRAGTTTAFYLGSRLSSRAANFWGRYEYDASSGQIVNANGAYAQSTMPVGNYAPNAWGLSDMIGNVWEWCQDWYAAYPTAPVTDPNGPTSGSDHLARGGDWGAFARFCRSAQRSGDIPAPASRRVGFRVVLSPVWSDSPSAETAARTESTE